MNSHSLVLAEQRSRSAAGIAGARVTSCAAKKRDKMMSLGPASIGVWLRKKVTTKRQKQETG